MSAKRNRITFQASDELKEATEQASKDRMQTVSAFVVFCLREWLVENKYIEGRKNQGDH